MSSSTRVEISVPSDQREGTTATISRWLKAVGDSVRKDEPLLEINTDKVTLEVVAPCDGVLTEILRKPKEKCDLAEPLGWIEQAASAAAAKPAASSRAPTATAAAPATAASCSTTAAGRALVSPAVKHLTAQHGVTLSAVAGTGKDGRVTARDVESFVASRSSTSVGNAALSQPVSQPLAAGMIEHTPMRRAIAQHMVHSMATAPHVTTVFQADFSAMIRDRAARKAEFEQRGVRLTFTAYFVAATVAALRAVPEVNSRWHENALQIFPEHHIGIATALEESQGGGAGLVVPVLRSAEKLDLFGLAKGLQEMTSKARAGKLTQKDTQGGTFTISNHGVSGSLIATPIIINQPQSAILGIGKLEKRIVVDDASGSDVMRIVPSAYITLTIDHRVLDGFSANKFLSVFVATLENPTTFGS